MKSQSCDRCANYWGFAITLVFSLALITGAWRNVAIGDESRVQPSKIPTPTELRQKSWISEGRTRFVQTCAYCHGTRGEGGKNRPFEEREGWNPEEIFEVIANGRIRGANAMPEWKYSFSEEEIWELVAYIKSLSKDFEGPLDKNSSK